jgi:hypothetical protein
VTSLPRRTGSICSFPSFIAHLRAIGRIRTSPRSRRADDEDVLVTCKVIKLGSVATERMNSLLLPFPGNIQSCGSMISTSTSEIHSVFDLKRYCSVLQRNVRGYPLVRPLLGGIWDRETALAIVDANAEPWMLQVEEARSRTPAPRTPHTASSSPSGR